MMPVVGIERRLERRPASDATCSVELRNLKSMGRERRIPSSGGLRLLPCEIESADSHLRGERSRQILAEEGASSGVIHDPRIGETAYFGNKARAGRVSCLVAQFAAIW
jgi:hypothetical protein